MLTTENIEQMRERHKQEIQELQDGCHHNKISECSPYLCDSARWSHCVKVCTYCGKLLFTTTPENHCGCKTSKDIIINAKLFECPEREDCPWLR